MKKKTINVDKCAKFDDYDLRMAKVREIVLRACKKGVVYVGDCKNFLSLQSKKNEDAIILVNEVLNELFDYIDALENNEVCIRKIVETNRAIDDKLNSVIPYVENYDHFLALGLNNVIRREVRESGFRRLFNIQKMEELMTQSMLKNPREVYKRLNMQKALLACTCGENE